MHIAAKTNEINSKNKSFKKARCGRNGKLCIDLFPNVLYFALHL